MRSFSALVRRDLRLAVREGGAIGTALGFFLVVVSLMPLGLGPDLNLLARIAAGVLWIALLLAALLSLGRIFEADYEDGTLDVLATGPLPLELVAAAKSLAHWITTGIPLGAFGAGSRDIAQSRSQLLSDPDRDDARRYPGGQLSRCHRRGVNGEGAPRRVAPGAHSSAALHPDVDLRHIGSERDGGNKWHRRIVIDLDWRFRLRRLCWDPSRPLLPCAFSFNKS